MNAEVSKDFAKAHAGASQLPRLANFEDFELPLSFKMLCFRGALNVSERQKDGDGSSMIYKWAMQKIDEGHTMKDRSAYWKYCLRSFNIAVAGNLKSGLRDKQTIRHY